MTDRINTLCVCLDKDYRDDDIQALANAIRMMKGVIGVELNVADSESWVAQTLAKNELRDKLWEVLYPKK